MMEAAANAPASTYARSNAHGLSLAQQSAVDLLAAGKNDTEAADALKLNRVTITRWRLYSPEFRAALADQRAAVWGASADRLRALLPKALDALADALEQADGADRVTVALAVLKLAGPLPLPPSDPTEAGEYVRREVERERDRARNLNESLDATYNLPSVETHESSVRKRLTRLAGPGEG
jgi:hypothetical protein